MATEDVFIRGFQIEYSPNTSSENRDVQQILRFFFDAYWWNRFFNSAWRIVGREQAKILSVILNHSVWPLDSRLLGWRSFTSERKCLEWPFVPDANNLTVHIYNFHLYSLDLWRESKIIRSNLSTDLVDMPYVRAWFSSQLERLMNKHLQELI